MIQEPAARTLFADLDRQPAPVAAMMLAALERLAAHPEIRRLRRVAQDALAPAPGQRLLDAGCGLGEVARELAAVTGGGEVVALDFSAVTVAAAAQRDDGGAVRYLTGDVTALDFADGHFDGVRCERVLQHLSEPDRAVAELVRVTRPGGRVCLIDTDWESLVVDGLPGDLIRTVRDHLFGRNRVHHRDIGRTLRRRLVRAGLSGVTATPVTLCFPDAVAAAGVVSVFNPEVPPETNLIPDRIRAEWFAAIAAADERGELLSALTIWVATGSVA